MATGGLSLRWLGSATVPVLNVDPLMHGLSTRMAAFIVSHAELIVMAVMALCALTFVRSLPRK